MNENEVLSCISRQEWCENAFECGLFVSRTTPCMAVSPDGIAKVYPPSDIDESGLLTASIEIKTRFSEATRKDAIRCTEQYGAYFSCTVGDDKWWEAVPSQNRAQD